MKKLLIGVMTTLMIGAANGDASSITTREFFAAMVSEGLVPQMDLEKSLHGTDSNKDGVRDDIEQLIDMHSEGVVRGILRASARTYQKILSAQGDLEKQKILMSELASTNACLARRTDGIKIIGIHQNWVDVLELFHSNTPEREDALRSFYAANANSKVGARKIACL